MNRLGSSARNAWRVSATTADLVREAGPSLIVEIDGRPKAVRFDLTRTALVVIDMQNDFCHTDGWLASIGVDIAAARRPIAPLCVLAPAVRAAGVPLIWVNWGNRVDRMNLPPAVLHVYDPEGLGKGIGSPLPANGSPVLQAGGWAAAQVDELVPAPEDICVDKYRMSGFWDTPLDSILRNLGVSTLLFAGVNLDQCVMATLQDANCLGYDCILLEDCSATTSPPYCVDATLYNIATCFGFVVSSADLLTALDGLPSR